MNLNELFELQRKLDEHIVKEKGLEGQDLLPKKILALQVELGELANEWRGFKYWSNDQEPRTEVPDFETWKKNGHKTYKGKPIMHFKNQLLEEYVDCLHFILSIGLEIGISPEEINIEPIYCFNVTEQFIDLFSEVSQLRYEERSKKLYEDYLHYDILFSYFIGLGEMLDFTQKEIEQAYIQKNQVNHERQAQLQHPNQYKRGGNNAKN